MEQTSESYLKSEVWRLYYLLLISRSMPNDYKTTWGIRFASPAAPLFPPGNQLSATAALQPRSQKAMGKLQAMACCQLNHHPREQRSFAPGSSQVKYPREDHTLWAKPSQ